ncbi:bacillithiol biosynthesis deacetylase BshB1 [Allomuricauda sp. SCSIO 65647]|uniref:bacillithiol biosynthesis deacetylase BshB1 n=1 Tax=Allomuricauda sp. SCSIO 65647 TaxID=2908843 RepID=UPI001F406766|nr:bacillithiol biosynthesis deacetylase BshB1 [Muricauda sp. SCSIO 65647]UJH67112.1 bacillithiol biosynthesis deacetylase BshB1 [Muricauda sp. SCSIO 65647]
MELDILVFGSHPDDAELGAGATIAKEVAQGKKVGIIDLTRGELGTRGTAEVRDREAEEASKILGLAVRENLCFADGFFVNDRPHQLQVVKMIRKYRPKIVLCNAVEDRHIDHARGSKLVSDACFLSGLVKIDTKLEDDDEEWQEPWRPKVVYHYIQWKNLEPDFVVDVSDYIEVKKKAIMAYGSQFYDPKSKEPETPISSKNFIDSVIYRARDLGRLIGVGYAEGFTVERNIGVRYLDDLI